MPISSPGEPVVASLSADTSLVARLLSGSTWRRRRLAALLMQAAGETLAGLGHLGVGELRRLGAGPVEARRLRAALELGRRARLPPPATIIRSPVDAFAAVAPELVGAETERFMVLLLDVRNRPRRVLVVARGSVDACPVDPREVFVAAVRERVTAILVAHNHPSGDPTPSPEDLALTERLRDAGALLGIRLLDHLIVGMDGRYVSLAEAGLLDQATDHTQGMPQAIPNITPNRQSR